MDDEWFEDLLGDEWTTDGFGPFDSNLVHEECGTMIEQDAKGCPECGTPNPLVQLGLI